MVVGWGKGLSRGLWLGASATRKYTSTHKQNNQRAGRLGYEGGWRDGNQIGCTIINFLVYALELNPIYSIFGFIAAGIAGEGFPKSGIIVVVTNYWNNVVRYPIGGCVYFEQAWLIIGNSRYHFIPSSSYRNVTTMGCIRNNIPGHGCLEAVSNRGGIVYQA